VVSENFSVASASSDEKFFLSDRRSHHELLVAPHRTNDRSMASTTPSGVPSSREKKYDRQLRLWGADGQNKLEAAHIALFGASATGCETLKNLILPSVGKFTIIDDKKVVDADLGVNFFLDEDSIGKSRAERTAALLGELNPDVRGDYIEDVCDHAGNLFALPGRVRVTYWRCIEPFEPPGYET